MNTAVGKKVAEKIAMMSQEQRNKFLETMRKYRELAQAQEELYRETFANDWTDEKLKYARDLSEQIRKIHKEYLVQLGRISL